MTDAAPVARIRIILEDVEPEVVRRLEVPLDLSLHQLHQVIQEAVGWTDSHLYEFRIREIGWGIPDPNWSSGDDPLDARKATILDVLEDTGARTWEYVYDFGDGWEHTIRIQGVNPADPDTLYPVLLDAVGRCPPEDVGGPPGYEDFLQAIADPSHERREEFGEFFPDEFDPHVVDIDEIRLALRQLAESWKPKTRRKNRRTPR